MARNVENSLSLIHTHIYIGNGDQEKGAKSVFCRGLTATYKPPNVRINSWNIGATEIL